MAGSSRSASAGAGAAIAAALARVEANVAGARAGDAEGLHQVRVGLRRLRSILQAYRGLLPDGKRKRLARELRKALPKLGDARDWDVFIAWLVTQPGADRVVPLATRRRQAAQGGVQRALSSKNWRRLLADMGELSGHPRAQAASQAAFACKTLDRAHRKVMKQARRMDWKDDADRHALRVKLKRLRYSCEFLGPLFPGAAAAAWLRDLKRLQDVFGELNDARVGLGLLGEIAPDERRLRHLLERRRARLQGELRPAWRSLERRRPFWPAPE